MPKYLPISLACEAQVRLQYSVAQIVWLEDLQTAKVAVMLCLTQSWLTTSCVPCLRTLLAKSERWLHTCE